MVDTTSGFSRLDDHMSAKFPHSPALFSCLFALSSMSAPGALYLQESFDYSVESNINGVSSYNGGSGFAGAWQGTSTGTYFSVDDGLGHSHGGNDPAGLTFSGLSAAGSYVLTRISAPGGAQVNRTINSTIASSMTSGTLYFSVLVRTKFYSVGNENLAFMFGSSDVLDPNAKPVTSGAGDSIGFALQGIGSAIDFRAIAVDGGVTSLSVVGGLAHTSPQIHMIYGEITWGATDTITLFSSTTDTDLSSFTQFATLDATLSEGSMDTLHIAGQQVSTLDEIRFGSSLADVGVTNIPEASAAMLGMLGSFLLLRRRR